MTFEATRSQYSQYHFTVIEVDLPEVTGVGSGFGTPLSSGLSSTGTKTYKFTEADAPPLEESGILRIVTSIKENVTKLKPQAGLASRGSGSVVFVDIDGDPNPSAEDVTDEVVAAGSWLSKWDARNIMINKPIRIRNYRLEDDGTVDLTASETRHYIVDTFDSMGKGKWVIKFKDELSRINLGETTFPNNDFKDSLRADEDTPANKFFHNGGCIDGRASTHPYVVGEVVRLGDELMRITGVDGSIYNWFVSTTRGNSILGLVGGNFLSGSTVDFHEEDDEVFLCDECDDEDIDLFLARVLISAGVDPAYIPTADWAAEIADWHPTDKINTLWIEAEDSLSVIKQVLSDFLLDMWFDPVAQEIKLSAVSQWRETSTTLTEGIDIDYESIRRKKEESLRYTRALVVYNKLFLAEPKSIEHYKSGALFKRTDLETDDLFGEPKVKVFEFSKLLSKNAAELLVARYVARNINPFSFRWTTQERKLYNAELGRVLSVGDVVKVRSNDNVGFAGSPSGETRAQIMSISPKYTRYGREYKVEALSYDPVIVSGSEFVLSGNVTDLNLFIHAGAPANAVTLTFVFLGVTGGSSSSSLPAIRAGAFASGSKIIIILAGGSDMQAAGGTGGEGQAIEQYDRGSPYVTTVGDGKGGGTVYDAEGIDTDIYFSGATTSTAYPDADGMIRAPSGGNGGGAASLAERTTGPGGNGGTGRVGGKGGAGGDANTDIPNYFQGDSGTTGGEASQFGQTGLGVIMSPASSAGGAAGRGVVDNGGTVVFYPASPGSRYVNGNGDH